MKNFFSAALNPQTSGMYTHIVWYIIHNFCFKFL